MVRVNHVWVPVCDQLEEDALHFRVRDVVPGRGEVTLGQGDAGNGQTVEHFGLTQTPWIGAVIVLVAFLLIGLSGRLDKPARVALG